MFEINDSTENQEINGVWTTFRGGKFKVAHTNNLVFQREFTRLQAPYRKKVEKGTLDPKIQLEIMCKSMAKGILLDWSNVGEKGNEVQYSRETAEKVLMHNSDLREYIQDFATDLENFRMEDLEDQGES